MKSWEYRNDPIGYSLPISRSKEIKLNNATITTADISASNGVVHVIDQVIIGEK